jgi:hypothetical protein
LCKTSVTNEEVSILNKTFNITNRPTSYHWYISDNNVDSNTSLRFINQTLDKEGKEIISLNENIYVSNIVITKLDEVAGYTEVKGGKISTSNLIVKTGAKIGAWDITDDGLIGQYNDANKSYWTGILLGNPAKQTSTDKQVAFFAGASSSKWDDAPFYVSQNGYFKAIKGKIASFEISDTGLVGQYGTLNGTRYVGIGLFNPIGTEKSFFAGATTTGGFNALFYVTPNGHVNM